MYFSGRLDSLHEPVPAERARGGAEAARLDGRDHARLFLVATSPSGSGAGCSWSQAWCCSGPIVLVWLALCRLTFAGLVREHGRAVHPRWCRMALVFAPAASAVLASVRTDQTGHASRAKRTRSASSAACWGSPCCRRSSVSRRLEVQCQRAEADDVGLSGDPAGPRRGRVRGPFRYAGAVGVRTRHGSGHDSGPA